MSDSTGSAPPGSGDHTWKITDRDFFNSIKSEVEQTLLINWPPQSFLEDDSDIQRQLKEQVNQILSTYTILLSTTERQRLQRRLFDSIFGGNMLNGFRIKAIELSRAIYHPAYPYASLLSIIKRRFLNELKPDIDITRKDKIRRLFRELFNAILSEENMLLSKTERERLFESLVADILGLGPLEPLLDDDEVEMILVFNPEAIQIKRRGIMLMTAIQFRDEAHLQAIIQRIAADQKLTIYPDSPPVALSMRDGNVARLYPQKVDVHQPRIIIQKFSHDPFEAQDLIRFGTMTVDLTKFLRAAVVSGINTLVVGAAGSGKTTLMNVLSGFIPEDERIISSERVAALQLQREHVLPLQSSEPFLPPSFLITLQPDRLIMDDVASEDLSNMVLAALQTPLMATMRANTIEAALQRLEFAMMTRWPDVPLSDSRDHLIDAFDLIVLQHRLPDGSRRVMRVIELARTARGRYDIRDLFVFEQTGFENNKIIGRIRPTGTRPFFEERLAEAGEFLAPSMFGIGTTR